MTRIGRTTIGIVLLGLLALAGSADALAQIQVTAANPNNAAQGTIDLDVIVQGNGFKRGAQAQWFVSGTTNPGGVTVNSTAFNSSGQLTANITVAVDANVGGFDVVVTNTDGRSGKGTELFAVNNAANKSTACNSNVTSILDDYDVTNNNAPFQIQSDGLGSYTTYSAHKDSVSSVIQSDCSWTLNTTSSQSRGIALTLAYPYSSGSPAPFTGTQIVKAVINSHCSTNSANNGIDFGTMNLLGQTLTCPINVGFYFNGVWYNIGINPYNWPGTTQTQVTCGGLTAGACNQWTVVPDPTTAVRNPTTNQISAIGELILPPCVGCTGGTPMGLYEVSFSFLIHK